jgi:hypothetical protein
LIECKGSVNKQEREMDKSNESRNGTSGSIIIYLLG